MLHPQRRISRAVDGSRPGDGLEERRRWDSGGARERSEIARGNKATSACTETTHGHGRAGKGNGPSISFQVTHGWRDAGCTDKLGLGARALEGRKVWCEWDIRQASNGRTPPFPRTGTGQTPSKFQILFSEKKRDEEERTDHLHQPCVSPQTCPPSLIETSLVRNSLAQSSDRCTHGSGTQKVGTSSGQIGLTKTVLSGRPLQRAKSPRINRAPTAWILLL